MDIVRNKALLHSNQIKEKEKLLGGDGAEIILFLNKKRGNVHLVSACVLEAKTIKVM